MLHILVIFLSIATLSEAHAGFRLMIPNGINVPNPCANAFGLWNGVGHNVEVGGGPANVFGQDFVAANATWSVALCKKDSDSDGKTNGEELGDKDCTWKLGMPDPGPAIGHPGICEPMTNDACKTINANIVCNSVPTIILP